MPGPVVPERLCRSIGDFGRVDHLHEGTTGQSDSSPVVLGQVTEKFREAVKALTEREHIPLYQFDHKERKDDIANDFRRKREIRDGVVFVGVALGEGTGFPRQEDRRAVLVHARQDGLRQSLLLLH